MSFLDDPLRQRRLRGERRRILDPSTSLRVTSESNDKEEYCNFLIISNPETSHILIVKQYYS